MRHSWQCQLKVNKIRWQGSYLMPAADGVKLKRGTLATLLECGAKMRRGGQALRTPH